MIMIMINVKLKQGLNKIIFQRPIKFIRSLKYKNTTISIISNNCAGGILYHDNGKCFLSPTINLFFENEGFICFLENIYDIKSAILRDTYSNTYPIGSLNMGDNDLNIIIHFLHYNSFNDALLKWIKRTKRINFDRIVILFIEREKLTIQQFERLMRIECPKLIISPYRETDNNILKIDKKDLDRLFLFRGITGKRYYEKYFDLRTLDKKMKRGT